MEMLPDTVAATTVVSNTSATNTNSVITIAAPTAGQIVIDNIIFGYADTPNTGFLKINSASNNMEWPITAAGVGQLYFGDKGLPMAEKEAVTVTLVNGQQTKYVTVAYR
jgi:hypothetical protein